MQTREAVMRWGDTSVAAQTCFLTAVFYSIVITCFMLLYLGAVLVPPEHHCCILRSTHELVHCFWVRRNAALENVKS